MAIKLCGKKLETIGVIGSGQIGPDIALYFVQNGFRVAVVDVSKEALEAGSAKLQKKIQKQVDKKRLEPERAEAMRAAVSFSTDYQSLAPAQLVIEAATEDLAIKHKIFAQVESICAQDAVIASNSSHLEPDKLFSELGDGKRALVTHFFYPAERNPVVEVVPGQTTSDEAVHDLMLLFELTGKLPVYVKPRYGYAIDPVFEGLCIAACDAFDRGLGSIKEIDAVCEKVLGQGVGPFKAMNLTGALPLLDVGAPHYQDAVMPWFHVPALVKAQLEKGTPFETATREETVDVDEQTAERISRHMLGAYYMLACDVVDAGLISISDYEEVISLALDMKPPFSMMNKRGLDEALALCSAFAEANEGARVPQCLADQAAKKAPWRVLSVQRHDGDGVALLTIRRFKVLNALSSQVLEQLEQHAHDIAKDDSIKAVVLRGFGTRAFVAGADIKQLAALQTPQEGETLALAGQRVVRSLEALEKPVIAAMNGLAFGGGNELAMACHARIAAKGQKVFVAQPEPKLGVIPGYGGTQRLPRLIGVANAWPLLRHGNPISSAQALEWGLLHSEVPREELLATAFELAKKAAAGEVTLPRITEEPIDVPQDLPDVDIGHLSTAIDAKVQQATLQGAKLSLQEGLALEAKLFGECLTTKDYRIGMTNFLQKGPRSNAEFANE
jgi:enoyl-CoA hydratase/3-hydroxyacyl-CoA dehydrogenase